MVVGVPVSWEAQHDLASVHSIQEQAVPRSGPHNNVVTALPLSSEGQTCTHAALHTVLQKFRSMLLKFRPTRAPTYWQ